MLVWQRSKNVENSLKFFLDASISSDSVTDISGALVPVRIGRKEDDNWTLPCISVYIDSQTNPKPFIGSNQTDDRYLIIIDLYTENEGERMDIADWMTQKLINGWRYYTYTVNPNSPQSPSKTAAGWVSIDFLTNTRVSLGQNAAVFEQHRHRISLNGWITG